MNGVIAALFAAFRSLLHPRMLGLMLWPMLVAIAVWLGIAFFFWGDWVQGLTQLVQASPLEQWAAQGMFAVVAHYLISTLLVLLLFPAIYVTALVITAIFSMPMMVAHVAGRHYPELEKRQGGTLMGGMVNALVAVTVYVTGWLLSLPLCLFSPFALLLPPLLMAYLNQRLFRYDALAEHASRVEIEQILERATPRLYLLGLILGVLQFVPVLNLFLPVYSALAFIHLCLAELRALRQSSL